MSKITINELAIYAVEQLESDPSIKNLASKITAFLLEERRSRDMPAVLRAVDEELARRGSSQVTITSAHAVSEQAKKQLAELLEVKNPSFHEIIDLSVIGGVKARSGETEIDLTVKAKLQRFKAKVMENN